MSIGETLGQARRDAGLTVKQISERTRIRETVIRRIEQDDYSLCGGNFYARGHIRSIARMLDVDPDPMIREYDESHGGAPGALAIATAFEPEQPLKFRERRTPNWSAAMAVTLVLVMVYGVFQVFNGEDERTPAPVTASSANPALTAAPATATPGNGDAHALGEAPAGQPSAAIGENEVVVMVRATKQCWVNVRDAAGKVLFSAMIPKGQQREWRAEKRLRVLIGNAAGVVLTVNGKELGVPGEDGQVLRLTFVPGSSDPV
ncbi:RodZ domain-containing protein [Actinocorallia sp. B10E7]|uniref:helix-turn-helix domain-containing protein n=1 Tax=Actinocorallia sp. B10E7 TaxID=3153558 RepID=UPI00325E401E